MPDTSSPTLIGNRLRFDGQSPYFASVQLWQGLR